MLLLQKMTTMANKHISMVESAFRRSLQLGQREYAALLGVSRSVLNMYENGKRSLPLPAHLKHSRLLIAWHASTKTTERKAYPAPDISEACCRLLDQHLRHCHNTLMNLQRQQRRMENRHQKLHRRRETLAFIRNCSGPGCDMNEEKWLADKCTANDHALACCKTEQEFLLQHKIQMMLAEIAATEEAISPLTP